MRRYFGWVCVVLVLCVSGSVLASTIPLSLVAADLGVLIPASSPVTTLMTRGLLKGEVISQAFTDVSGDCYYLYQVENKGLDSSWHVIETFTLFPFAGADGSTSVGYLTANIPANFDASGTKVPAGASVNPESGPTISFAFPGFLGYLPIAPGELSKVLYIKSTLPADEITGNIIDGTIADGPIVGPIPEPATIGFLLCGLFLLIRPRRRA